MTNTPITTILGFLKNEARSQEAALNRLNKMIKAIEEMEAAKSPSMAVTISLFLESCCIEDPGAWDSANRVFDEFADFKATMGIQTKVLKRNFFTELEKMGFYRNQGPIYYENEPKNSIRGLYLKRRQGLVEAEKANKGMGLKAALAYLDNKQQEERAKEDEAFKRVLGEDLEPDTAGGRDQNTMFDF